MWISDLALNDFRSYTSAVLSLEPGVSVFLGENGHGKTNLVEAVAYLATFSSHRVAADTALVRQSAQAAVIRAKVRDHERTQTVEVEILSGKANRARLNRGSVKPRELLGLTKVVVFAPEDLVLVSGDPSTRRRFLDDVSIQRKPRFAQLKAEYDKVLKHRAALLKASLSARKQGLPIDEVSFDIWDEKLATLGAAIVSLRAQLISDLRPHIQQAYEAIAPGRGHTHVVYKAHVDDASAQVVPPEVIDRDGYELVEAMDAQLQDEQHVKERLLHHLRETRDKEIDRGVNLVGPHRDDLMLGLGSLPARGFASHGETWSYALALRFAAFHLLKEEHDDPILILDDVFAELDSRRRDHLVSLIEDIEQVLVTTAVGTDIPTELSPHIYRVRDGEVTRES